MPAAVAVMVVAGGIAFTWRRASEREPGSVVPVGAQVNPAAPEYKLLQDALDISAERREGSVNFSYVPRRRPPGLLRMHIGGQGDAVTDGYQFGPQKLMATAAFSEKPTSICDTIRKGESSGLCVRDSATTPAPALPAFRHVVVYFSGNVGASPDAGDPGTAAAKQFWAETEMVPVEEAGWFTELLDTGRRSSAD